MHIRQSSPGPAGGSSIRERIATGASQVLGSLARREAQHGSATVAHRAADSSSYAGHISSTISPSDGSATAPRPRTYNRPGRFAVRAAGSLPIEILEQREAFERAARKIYG